MIIGGWRGPGWRITDADPGQARVVRDWIRSAISRHDGRADPADAALAVSELYANAVMHGPAGGRVLAGYCLWADGARIVVCDGGGTGTPRVRPGGGLAEGGRGLEVVDALATAWGSFRLPEAQVVWCDFGQPLRVPDPDAWAWLRRVLAACPLTGSTACRTSSGQPSFLATMTSLVSASRHGACHRQEIIEAGIVQVLVENEPAEHDEQGARAGPVVVVAGHRAADR